MQSAKVSTSPAMENALTIINFGSAPEKVGTGFSLRLHNQTKFDLAAGRSLLSFYAPPPPGVPPANIHLTARTSDGSGRFWLALQKSYFPTNHHIGYPIRVSQAAV